MTSFLDPPACISPLCHLAQLASLLLTQHFIPTHAFKLFILPPTSYLLPCTLMFLAVFLYLLLPLSLLTPSGFFNEMLEAFVPGALNYYALFRLNLLASFVSRNLTLIHLPLSGSLDSLLCDQIAPTPDRHSLSRYHAC